MAVHSRCQSFLPILVKSVGRHGQDGNLSSGSGQVTDRLCRLVAVHFRHLDIHENCVIIILRLLFQRLHTFLAVSGPLCLKAAFLQKRHCDLRVKLVVLSYQNPFPLQHFRKICPSILFLTLGIRSICQSKRKPYDNLRAGSNLAFHLDRTIHKLRQGFHDGKPQAGSRHLALRTGSFTGKLFKNVRQVLLTHSDACICNLKTVGTPAFFFAGLFLDPHRNTAALRRILDGITHNIQKNLPHFGPVAAHIFMLHLKLAAVSQSFFADRRLKNCIQRFLQLLKIAHFPFQCGFAALDSGHLQHIVDERQKKGT